VVLGGTLGFFFAGQLVSGFVPILDMLTPWALPRIAVALVMEGELPGLLLVPVAMTAIWVIAFLLIALRRFERSE
jgi:hypothetical protein